MFSEPRRIRTPRKRARPRRSPSEAGRAVPRPQPAGSPGRGRFHRFLLRRRRLLAGLLIAAAAGVTVQALLPADAATIPAAAASHDLPAGHVLTPQDLRLVRLPSGSVPPGTLTDIGQAVGEQLAAPLRGGTVVSETVLVGDSMLTGAPEGSAAVPLRPADPAAAGLLSPGVLVDVVVAPAEGFDGAGDPVVLASGLPVLWITGSPDTQSPWPAAGAGEPHEQLVVVAAPAPDAPKLAVASVRGEVYLVPSGR